jgi:hypothetical protein
VETMARRREGGIPLRGNVITVLLRRITQVH